ncbi:Cyclic nucleotide-gated cation channel beta-1, partial [Ophiophagus hannah]
MKNDDFNPHTRLLELIGHNAADKMGRAAPEIHREVRKEGEKGRGGEGRRKEGRRKGRGGGGRRRRKEGRKERRRKGRGEEEEGEGEGRKDSYNNYAGTAEGSIKEAQNAPHKIWSPSETGATECVTYPVEVGDGHERGPSFLLLAKVIQQEHTKREQPTYRTGHLAPIDSPRPTCCETTQHRTIQRGVIEERDKLTPAWRASHWRRFKTKARQGPLQFTCPSFQLNCPLAQGTTGGP